MSEEQYITNAWRHNRLSGKHCGKYFEFQQNIREDPTERDIGKPFTSGKLKEGGES